MYKNLSLIVFMGLLVIFFSGCTTKITEETTDAYVKMDIQFNNKEYMEDQPLRVPKGVNEANFGKLPFAGMPGFIQNNSSIDGEMTSDTLSNKVFKSLKRDFESVLAATNRFPVAQIREGLADNELRKATRNGTVNVDELDASELVRAKYIVNVAVEWNSSSSQKGSQNTIENIMKWNCSPMEAKNNRPIDWFPPFVISVKERVYQKISASGRVLAGPRLHSSQEWEKYILNLAKTSQVKFINYIYNYFPAGGKINEFSEDLSMASVNASRSTGLLADMEMIIYARKKGNPNAMRIPLFNATVNMAQVGSSELYIWRAADTKVAEKIIEKIEDDPEMAFEDYDFYAASSGLAKPPEFIQTGGDI